MSSTLIDDWGLAKLSAEQCRDLLELLDDCHGNRSILVTSQLPVDHWHEVIGDSTPADAILDRLIHNAYRIDLNGESMRKRHAKLDGDTPFRVPMHRPVSLHPDRWQLSPGIGGSL